MIKRTKTETIYEYDKEGKLVRKTVTETNEEDASTTLTYPYSPLQSNDWWKQPYITWSNPCDVNTATSKTEVGNRNEVDSITTITG